MIQKIVVGIDLGTTHTVVAFADPARQQRAPVIVPIPQLTAMGEVAARPLYPSALYAPLAEESAALPNVLGDSPWITGELAKKRGAEVPGRLVASAKSWLCHAGVDRLAPILPWGAHASEEADEATATPTEGALKISPVDASARILAHVRRAWDEANPEASLFEQDIVLTVPASFDDASRELTVQAAERAGLEVRLLEEPLAAFYDYLARTPLADLRALAERAGGEARIMVIDVGGGTTDLSLLVLRATDDQRGVAAERVAVGRHLLLGGDNMDLALAHACEARLSSTPLAPARFAQLTGLCRTAKERLLGEDAPANVPIALASTGAKLVGGTLRTELARDEVERIVLDGFFPIVDREARPNRARAGLVAFGLPYEKDVAITRHVTEFVARHVPNGEPVHALLLNGGVFLAARVRDRIRELFAALGGVAPEILPHPDPDLAVARGAVAYGLALRGLALRVTAGAARAYYVGLDTTGSERRAMCVVPRGAPEETTCIAEGRGLALIVGKPVRFDLFMSDDAPPEHPGDIVDLDRGNYEVAPPLAVHFGKEKSLLPRARGSTAAPAHESVLVNLEGKLTAVGTLELACVERDGEHRRFKLAFQLRGRAEDGPPESIGTPPPPSIVPAASLGPRSLPPQAKSGSTSIGPKREGEAHEMIERAFGKPRSDATGREAKDLVRELERVLGERASWSLDLTRALFDDLVTYAKARRRSADHERAFWMLAGYCARPGFGAVGDEARVASLAPLFAERLAFPDEARNWPQFFIAWRRVAAGLSEETQVAIRDFVDPFLAPPEAGLKKPKKPKLEADFDMLELAASLERVPAQRRAALGGWILERTWTERDPRLWAALGRLGARVPLYASAHHVVSPQTAGRWLDHLLREKWETIPTAAPAALAMARRTGDRARDIDERVRKEIAARFRSLAIAAEARDAWVHALEEVVIFTDAERRASFGEDLPRGLVLL